MLNYIWAGMIIIGVVYGAFEGRMTEITNAALDSSKEAVALCITMMGVMSFWVGMMEIATKAGIIQSASRMIAPFIRFLFPRIPENHKAREYITTNIIANFLGLGWDDKKAAQYMKTYGITEMQTIRDIYELIIADPGNYLKYYIGYVEFLELKKKMMELQGPSFSQKDFHQKILEIGPAPFSILEKYMLP